MSWQSFECYSTFPMPAENRRRAKAPPWLEEPDANFRPLPIHCSEIEHIWLVG